MAHTNPIIVYEPTLAYAGDHSLLDPALAALLSQVSRHGEEQTARDTFQKFLQSACGGSVFAMCFCSRFCRDGWGTNQSDDEAFRWAKLGASNGFPPAYYELGRCYEDGIGVPRDLDEALSLYQVATEQGFGFAALHTASLYHLGKVNGDAGKDVEFARKAYELNEPLAAAELGRWYEVGEGVPKDLSEAATWYARASQLGDVFASGRLCLAYTFGDLGLLPDAEMASRYERICDAQTPAN
jgi:TPR repeat protein